MRKNRTKETKLTEHYIWELRKPTIDKFERAQILKEYMRDNQLSGRGFAAKFGFKKSTIEDWLLWNKLTEAQFKKMIRRGLTETNIYRLLRDNKSVRSREYADMTPLDIMIKRTTVFVKKQCSTMDSISAHTFDLLRNMVDCSNRLMFKIERNNR